MTLRMGWILDFIDKPADGLAFNFWSGRGDLSFQIGGETITYKGTNGVISINPPSEAANEAVRLVAEMDASDPNVRLQMRRDLGPLKVRLRWIYEKVSTDSNDGITPFVTPLNFWGSDGVLIYSSASNPNLNSNSVYPVRFRNVDVQTNIQVGTTYYMVADRNVYATQGWVTTRYFPTEAQAAAAVNQSPFVTLPGELNFTGNSFGDLVVGVFDSTSVVIPGERSWVLSNKQFIGRLGAPSIVGSVYRIEVESLISDLDRGRIEIWSHDAHQRKYPDDKAFEFMKSYKDGVDTKWPP